MSIIAALRRSTERHLGHLALAYVLRVIPGQGNNILRGDLNMDPYQLPFALPVNETLGDEMTFTLIPEPLTVLLLLMGVSLVGRRPRTNG